MRHHRTREVLFLVPGDVCVPHVEQIFAVRTCDGYARCGLDVRLVSIGIDKPCELTPETLAERYGVSSSFSITRIRTRLKSSEPSIRSFRLQAGFVCLGIALKTFFGLTFRKKDLVVHSRSPVMIAPFVALRLLLMRKRPALILETHGPPPPRAFGWIVRAVDLVVVNSTFLKRDIERIFARREEEVLHAQLAAYAPIAPQDQGEARRALDLPRAAPIACYAGNLALEQSDFLLRTAAHLRDRNPDFRLLVVGGKEESLTRARQTVRELSLDECVILTGFVDPAKVAQYLSAADVLVHYMSNELKWFEYCTPAKGWDYQASKRPIVVVGIPLFEEVFGSDGERAIRVQERTPQALAHGIERVLNNPDESRAMAERAAAWIGANTWDDRNRLILARLDAVRETSTPRR
jgi:glycosyltransferase involved in cell wall biosynthesis